MPQKIVVISYKGQAFVFEFLSRQRKLWWFKKSKSLQPEYLSRWWYFIFLYLFTGTDMNFSACFSMLSPYGSLDSLLYTFVIYPCWKLPKKIYQSIYCVRFSRRSSFHYAMDIVMCSLVLWVSPLSSNRKGWHGLSAKCRRNWTKWEIQRWSNIAHICCTVRTARFTAVTWPTRVGAPPYITVEGAQNIPAPAFRLRWSIRDVFPRKAKLSNGKPLWKSCLILKRLRW